MHAKLLVATGAAMVASAMPGLAQGRADADGAFTGAYVGAEAGWQEHRVLFEQSVPLFNTVDERTYRASGIGGGAFAGYDVAVLPRVRLGVAAGATIGGGDVTVPFARGRYRQEPQWGYRAGGRIGYVLGDRVLAYGTVGYGAHRYRIADDVGVEGAENWRRNVSYGGGIEVRVSRNVGARIEYREVPRVSRALMVGVPVRF